MHVHILGIGGTFMGGVAALAREAGHRVSGSDGPLYPPMSDQLAALGIEVQDQADLAQFEPMPDLVVIGNALSRGHPAVEHVLERGLAYTSGPAFLAEHVLRERWVLAVAGTHGKTTTSSMLAYLLDRAGLEPGFLIGGVPADFGISARLGKAPFFVVEADEYDTAFFDKRAKFVHYRPRTCVLGNLEFDHADIYPDLAAIERQFNHLLRTVPGGGRVIVNADSPALDRVLDAGCWSEVERFGSARDGGSGWNARAVHASWSGFTVQLDGAELGQLDWPATLGRHNAENALAAVAAARHAGLPVTESLAVLQDFGGVRRRMELRGEVAGVRVLDDFAHHPTAIRLSLEGLRSAEPGRVIALFEPRSNTMRMGHHRDGLAQAFAAADRVFILRPAGLDWDLDAVASAMPEARIAADIESLVAAVTAEVAAGDRIVVMSNGGFGGVHEKLLTALGR